MVSISCVYILIYHNLLKSLNSKSRLLHKNLFYADYTFSYLTTEFIENCYKINSFSPKMKCNFGSLKE